MGILILLQFSVCGTCYYTSIFCSTVSSNSDLSSGAAPGYPKSHTQAFDKSGFAAGTPPPFNLAGLPSGSQPGGLGGPAYVHYVPGMATQPQAPMLAHQLHQVVKFDNQLTILA